MGGGTTNVNSPGSSNSKNRLQESRSIGTQDANSGESMFLDVVSDASCPVCGFKICSPEHFVISSDVMDGRGLYGVHLLDMHAMYMNPKKN